MYVASGTDAEIRITLEALVDAANGMIDGDLELRPLLHERSFSRAADASEASMQRAERRLGELLPFLRALPGAAPDEVAARVNEELTELPITPSIVSHGGSGHHIHWTPSTARFDDQFLADVLMALASELCDNGTDRFGTCAADDCDRLFYDGTRNHSRRFCSDQRCASRTHTADHRARRRALG